MINWYWVYRDFIRAYDKCTSADDWIECYMELYLEHNRTILENIHYKPKGFGSIEDVLSRIKELGFEYFVDLGKSLDNINDLEHMVQDTTNAILKQFSEEHIDADVYVIVGLDCTNIYSTEYDGKVVTVICLESLQEFEKIKLLLSHEVHHWVRERRLATVLFGNCVGERAITEGLAISCSEFLFPGYRVSDYCYVSESTVNWVIEHWEEVNQLFLDQANTCDMKSGFFTRNKTSKLIKDMPPRIGYVYGYLKVKNYLRIKEETPVKLVGASWNEILQG